VAAAVVRTPDRELADAATARSVSEDRIQRLCSRCRTRRRRGVPLNCDECEEEVQRKRASRPPAADIDVESAAAVTEEPGQPLGADTRTFFEERMGSDFSRVRIHTGPSADRAAASVHARAFTLGSDVVFRSGEYRPDTPAGKRLLAHELTHVVQQGAAPAHAHPPAAERADRTPQTGLARQTIQRQPFPGQGMLPPGDCDWGTYLGLRGAVLSAKTLVSSLGACAPGDSCLFLATKIAAITAEIGARVGLDARCFRGGDRGHRRQVQDKVNMLNRCYQFFTGMNCPQAVVEAMEEVVERAREVIAQAAMAALVVAAVVALVAAIIVLAKAIVAAGVGAAVGAAIAAVLVVLVKIKELLAPEEGGETA
jgi:hypothetical protein